MTQRCYLKGIPVDAGPRTEIWQTVTGWLLCGDQPRQVVTLNAAMLIAAIKDTELKEIIQKADLIIADGYSIMSALKKDGFLAERYPGVELANQLLNFCLPKRLPVYCYGGTKESALRLKRKYDGLDGIVVRDGFAGPEELVEREIIDYQPGLLLVGLGSPRQEFFLAKLLPQLGATLGIGIGGALEIISGQKSRAPAFLSAHGWEWCYRMIQEPKKIKQLPKLIKFWHYFLR